MARSILTALPKRMRRFFLLSQQDQRFFLEATLLPLFITISFRVAGVPWTQSRLRRWALAGQLECPLPFFEIDSAHKAQSRVKEALRISGTCLTRSLTLWAMLLRRGVQTDLKVGFRKIDGKFEGHAWLEYRTIVLNESKNVVASYEAWGDPADFDRQLLLPGRSSWRR